MQKNGTFSRICLLTMFILRFGCVFARHLSQDTAWSNKHPNVRHSNQDISLRNVEDVSTEPKIHHSPTLTAITKMRKNHEGASYQKPFDSNHIASDVNKETDHGMQYHIFTDIKYGIKEYDNSDRQNKYKYSKFGLDNMVNGIEENPSDKLSRVRRYIYWKPLDFLSHSARRRPRKKQKNKHSKKRRNRKWRNKLLRYGK